ncbi:hypothetical protein VTO42DRAFT_3527 [Malbranchea cinnamomea]
MSSSDPFLSMLSATSFPDTLPQDTIHVTDPGSGSALYGELLIYSDPEPKLEVKNSPGEVSPDRKINDQTAHSGEKKTKRSQSGSDSGSGAPSKKRGRPRVETADETASERRRTQIRLAQRAYRLRKETALSSLHQRVAELEKTVEDMSKTFLALNDEVMNSGLLASHSELARQFRRAAKRFLSLAKVANHDSAHADNDSPGPEENSSSTASETQQNSSTSFQTQFGLNQSRGTESSFGIDGYDLSNLLSSATARQPLTQSLPHSISPSPQAQEVLDVEHLFTTGMLETKISQSPHISWPHDPLSPYTYSFQETTFSRRLHRRCLEMAYSSLTNPNVSPTRLQKAFRLSFNISSRSRMADVFRFLLQKRAGEPLESWNKPFYYIGGAGMHYPRKDKYGNEIYPPNMHPPEKAFGPLAFHLGETRHSFKSIEEVIEANDMSGTWFDCNDVEGYLNSKGIFLGSSSSFVEIHPSILANFNPGKSTSRSMSAESQLQTPYDMGPPPSICHSWVNQTGSQALSLLGIYGGNVTINNNINNPYPATPSATQQTMNLPVLDVDRFVTKLTARAVCLGRAPGFRQQDVDRALLACVTFPYR